MSKKVFLFLSVAILATLLFLLSTPFGSVPPLGSFFHPIHEFSTYEFLKSSGSVFCMKLLYW